MSEAVVAGFSAERAEWARRALDEVLAPEGEGASALAEELGPLDVEERWARLVVGYYRAVASEFQALAREVASAAGPSEGFDSRETEAGVVLALLDDLTEELSEVSPALVDLLAPELADAAERCRECLPDGPFEQGPPSGS